MAIEVVWFKRDLRFDDHAVLSTATLRGRKVLTGSNPRLQERVDPCEPTHSCFTAPPLR